MKHYFAYGSNLLRSQMKEWCPDHIEVGLGRLSAHQWIVTTRGYSNLIASPNGVAYGWVYRISAADEQRLDEREGPYYRARTVPVEVNGAPVSCLVYTDEAVTEIGPARPEYVDAMRRGLRDRALPPDYVRDCIEPFLNVAMKR